MYGNLEGFLRRNSALFGFVIWWPLLPYPFFDLVPIFWGIQKARIAKKDLHFHKKPMIFFLVKIKGFCFLFVPIQQIGVTYQLGIFWSFIRSSNIHPFEPHIWRFIWDKTSCMGIDQENMLFEMKIFSMFGNHLFFLPCFLSYHLPFLPKSWFSDEWFPYWCYLFQIKRYFPMKTMNIGVWVLKSHVWRFPLLHLSKMLKLRSANYFHVAKPQR